MVVVPYPSPNYFGPGDAKPIKAVCLHGTSGGVWGSLATLRDPRRDNPNARVSANYLISKTGVVYLLVDYTAGLRAFGNGLVENYDTSIKWLVAAVRSRLNPNLVTVSIEHEASYDDMIERRSMTDIQFTNSVELTATILRNCGLKANHESVIGHNQISGTRKYNCPGVIFVPAYVEQLIIRNPDLKP